MTQRTPYLDEIVTALAQPGCAFCRLLDDIADRLIDAILFESVNDVKVREGLKAFYDRIVPAAVEKLAKSWGARLEAAQFSTLSRHFDVRKLAGKAEWRVCNVTSRKVVGENFTTFAAAEAFRRSHEDAVLERVPTLYLSDEMRNDIRANGLPYLGAVGVRRDP